MIRCRHSRRQRLTVVGIVAAAVASAAAAVGLLGTPANYSRGHEVQVFVRRGAPFREAADSLAAHGVVRSGRLFAWYAHARGVDRTLRWGTYVLRDALSWEQVLETFRLARGIVHTVTIPEGWTLAEIAPAVGDALDLPADSILAAARDTAFLHRLRVPTPTLEGYLFPDTYSFPDRASAHDALRTMIARFAQAWKPQWDSILPRIRLTRHEVITLASIVEREAVRNEERPIIAAVYLNRLRAGMPLQADPTVDYALGRRGSRMLFKDLRVDSPYNTYRRAGLPPGPICSPGAASIEAVLHPADVPYRFFVAATDGHHEFRRTYAEHLAAIRMVRDRAARSAPGAAPKTKSP